MSDQNGNSRVNASPDAQRLLLESQESSIEPLDMEGLLQKAGGFGRFQWIMMIYATLCYQGVNFFIYGLTYLELVPALKCMYAGTTEFVDCRDDKDICHSNKVTEWEVDYSDSESFHNWMTDHKLYCKDSFLIGLFGSLYFVGFAINGLLLKQSDSIGRKNILIIGGVLQVICCYTLYFAGNTYVYYVFIFVSGISVAKNVCCYIYTTELVPERWQIYAGCVCLSLDPFIPMMTLSLYFYSGGKDWKVIYISALVLCVIGCALTFIIPESPRYLYARKRWDQLRANLKSIAKINRVEMGDDYLIEDEVKDMAKIRESKSKKHQAEASPNEATALEEDEVIEEFSVLKTLKQRVIFVNFIVVIICFCVVSFNYYMVSFYMKYVGGNIFINTMSSTVSECIGNFAAGFIQKYIGTKKSFILCFGASCVCALPLLFVKEEYLIATCVFSSKFFVEATFCLVYYVNPEMFPALFVPFSFSICGFCARVATIAAPEVAEVKPRQIPIIIFLAFAGVATASALFLSKPKKKVEDSSEDALLASEKTIPE